MEVTTEKLEENQVLLNVQVEEDLVEKSMDQAYRRLVQRTNIPGFRRGKAPRSMLERFVGRNVLMEKALEDLIPELCQKALKEQGIESLGDPKVELVQVDPVVFKAVVALPPVVELPDYRQIRATPREAQVSEEQIDGLLEDLRRGSAPWEPSEGLAKMGDLLNLDIRAEEDGVEVLNLEDLAYVMSEKNTEPAPGLAEHLRGLSQGETTDFPISYPADHEDETWAGRKVEFHVHVTEIKEKHLPVLDDEFAKGVGEGFEGQEALRQHLRSRLEEDARNRSHLQLEDEVVQAVVAGARLEFPPMLAQEEVDILVTDLAERFESQGISLSQYLKFKNKTMNELRDELLPRAKERVKRRLVIERVADLEGINAESGEVDDEIDKASKEMGPRESELRTALSTPGGRASVVRILRTRKAVARMVELATAEAGETQAPGDEAVPQSEGE